MKIKYVILTIFILIISAGCNKQKDYTLKDVLHGYHYEKNETEYVMKDVGQNIYAFYFDETNIEHNYFRDEQYGKQKVYYKYIQKKITVNECVYDVERDFYQECNEEEQKLIRHAIFAFEHLLETMKLTIQYVSIVEQEVSTKIIQIPQANE